MAKPWGKTPTCMGILPQAVVGVSPCVTVYIFPPERTQKCWYLQMKWDRNEIKENSIIKCKIIVNSNISNTKSSSRLTSITRKYMKLGVNLVKPGKTQKFRGEILDILGSHKCLMLF